MSEIGLNINVDSYNNEGIKTIKGNNNAEIYKLYILKNKRRLNLVGKTVKLGYVMAGTSKGDIIENLNITNAEQGEITLPITNRISKKDGVYTCQLAIYGTDEFLEYTATFGLTIENNIFTKIAGEIENSKDLTYIERILEEAKTVSGDLKTNIPVATNLNSSLESNISNARNINTTLADTTEKSKVAATDAIEKKSQLEKSITKAKEFIDGLDGSQNIPQIRMDVTELQNGLKSNQALEYMGSSVTANDTLEGRTEGMFIKGRTLQNIIKMRDFSLSEIGTLEGTTFKINRSSGSQVTAIALAKKYLPLLKSNTVYTVMAKIENNTLSGEFALIHSYQNTMFTKNPVMIPSGFNGFVSKKFTTIDDITLGDRMEINFQLVTGTVDIKNLIILEGDYTNTFFDTYFEDLKSFGEAEQEGDKYKISILSRNKNLFNDSSFIGKDIESIKTNYPHFKQNIKLSEGNYCSQIEFTDGTKVMDANFIVNGFDEKNTLVRSFLANNIRNLSTEQARKIAYLTLNWNDQGLNSYRNKLIKNISLIKTDAIINGEPYQSDKKDILISAPLRNVDDVQDIMYEDNGQVKVDRKLGKYTFTGDENWQILRDEKFVKTIQFYLDTSSFMNKNSHLLCNTFSFELTRINEDKEGISKIGGNGLNVWININRSKLTTQDVDGFKAWLKANPTTIVYQLATPTIELVENCIDIDLDTYQEKTYFNILNSLPGTLDFKVPSNIGSVVQNIAKEVNNIWDVINNLLVPSIVKANGNLAMLKLNNNLN